MPAPADLPTLLRGEVGAFRRQESRRRFDASVYVGRLGGSRAGLTIGADQLSAGDRQLRVEVLLGLLERCQYADTVWLTREGVTEISDEDLAWLAAAEAAFGVFGGELRGVYALTREGWLDIRSTERRVWKRLRL